jgi:seryl-tRNA synthetase
MHLLSALTILTSTLLSMVLSLLLKANPAVGYQSMLHVASVANVAVHRGGLAAGITARSSRVPARVPARIPATRLLSTSTSPPRTVDSVDSVDGVDSVAGADGVDTASLGRIPRTGTPLSHTCGLDPSSLRTSLPLILSHCSARSTDASLLSSIETLPNLLDSRSSLILERDKSLASRKSISAQVAIAMKNNDAALADKLKVESAGFANAAAACASSLNELDLTVNGILQQIPNLLDDSVPPGANATSNVVVSTHGDLFALPLRLNWSSDFIPQWHDTILTNLQMYHPTRSSRMSGTRFPILSSQASRLARALESFFIDSAAEKGYQELQVPYVVSRTALTNTGQLPKFQKELFQITSDSHTCNNEDAFLIPTAEVPVMNFHASEIIPHEDLPLSYVCSTPCFRSEAGSYGSDTRGLIRSHQFQKVELIQICAPEQAKQLHEKVTNDAEDLLKALELPYRKVSLCAGDIGFAAEHCYDLEVWLPGQAQYREISSCSNVGDFQSRRMGLRYRPANDDKGKKVKPVLCHSINGSGLAVGRALVAVIENYQREDGSVVIPDVLRSYMGGMEVLERKDLEGREGSYDDDVMT